MKKMATIQTVQEIYGQPDAWRASLRELSGRDAKSLLFGAGPTSKEWVFVGCGTSYYLAQAAAASTSALLGVRARAVPASEFLLFRNISFPGPLSQYFPILISRSGHTTEVLQVADVLLQEKADFLGITCDGRELEQKSKKLIRLPVKEESTVMTSSFTSMLLALQYLAASSGQQEGFIRSLSTLPDTLERLLDTYGRKVEQFADHSFENVAFLGQGPLFSIACESALKVMESSSTYAEYFHTLEFRHGPKSVVNDRMLIGGLISESGYATELAVLRESRELGGTTLAIANKGTAELRDAADLLIELQSEAPELARLVLYVVWGQLLGSYRGVAKGLDPDNPTNLSRVVTL